MMLSIGSRARALHQAGLRHAELCRAGLCRAVLHTAAVGVAIASVSVCFDLAQPTAAWANPYSVHAEASVSAGWTDNANNRPEIVDEATQSLPESGFFTQIRPSVLLTYETLRSAHVAVTSVDINLFETQEPSNTYNGSLNYNGRVTLTPITELGLGTSVGFGRVDPLITGQAGEVQGDTTFISFGASESINRQLGQNVRLSQGLSYSFVRTTSPTIDPDTNIEVENDTDVNNVNFSLSADRNWDRYSLGTSGSVSYIGSVSEDNDTHQLVMNIAATGRYDLGPLWTSSASIGLGAVTTLSATSEAPGMGDDMMDGDEDQGSDDVNLTPTASASVSYLQDVGPVVATLTASMNHSIVPNLLLGNASMTSSGVFNASLPLPWLRSGPNTTMNLSSTLSLSHSRPEISFASGPNSNTFLADLALSWAFSEGMSASVRYQFTRTDISNYEDSDFAPPEEFFRHTVLIGMGGRFPVRQAVTLPNRRIIRVDDSVGGDEQRGQRR